MNNFFLGMAAGAMCVLGAFVAYSMYHLYKDGGVQDFIFSNDGENEP